MPQDPVDQLIRRLVGSEPVARSDRDPSAEHMRMAAYLDGGMTPDERAAYERELAQSPDRREELLSAVAWSDEIDAKRQAAPDHLVGQVLALDARSSRKTADAWWRGWLPASGRQWVFAGASVLASIAIAFVAFQAARNAPGPSFKLPDIAGLNGPRETRPAISRVTIPMSDALAKALAAYDRNSGARERADLVAALKNAGRIPYDLEGATIEVAKPLHDRLQRSEPLGAVTLGPSLDGHLILGLAD